MSEQYDAFDEVLDIPPENYHQTPNVYVDSFILYLTSDEFKLLIYMLRNVTGRKNFHHHSLAISVIVNGRQFEKSYCVGIGMKEAAVRKCLQSLSEFGFIVPIGKPTPMGQNWKIGKQIKMGELRKRYQEKLERDVSRIQVARSNRGKVEGDEMAYPSCPTEPLLSDRTGDVLSDKTPDLLSDRTQRKKEEIQKKEKLLAPAIADRAGATSPSHTSSLADEADDPAMFQKPTARQLSSRAENGTKRLTAAVAPSPSLKQKPPTAQNTPALTPHSAPPPLSHRKRPLR